MHGEFIIKSAITKMLNILHKLSLICPKFSATCVLCYQPEKKAKWPKIWDKWVTICVIYIILIPCGIYNYCEIKC